MPPRKGLSPVQRTLRALRQQGCICDIVERFNAYAGQHGKRMDCFGFVDILAISPDGIVAIQACGQSFSQHKQKILENEYAPEWLGSGGLIQLWSWRKVKLARGGKAMRWKPRIAEFSLDLNGNIVCDE